MELNKNIIIPNNKIIVPEKQILITKSFSKQDFAQLIYEKYSNNCTQFVVDYTKLFHDLDGTVNRPYAKQYEFMNTLRKKDRVTVVIKCRQCVSKDTYIETNHGTFTIEELYNLKKKIIISNIKVKSYSEDKNKIVFSNLEDVFQTGVKKLFKVTFSDNNDIKSTLEHEYYTFNTITNQKDFKKLQDIDLNNEMVLYLDKYVYIKDIEYYKTDITYDLNTEENNYFADNILVHNSGFSTAIVARAFFDCYFGKVQDTVIVSATKTQAIKVMRRIKQCFLDLPEAIRPDFKVDQAQEIILFNNCRVVSLSSNPSSMRGWTGVFMLDEYAMHSPRLSEEIYEACYPATTKGGRIVAVSTPFGTKGMYHQLATKSFKEISGNKNANNQRLFYVHWRDVPHVKRAVEEEGLLDGLPFEMVDQEYELNFRELSSEESLFSKEFLFENFNEKDSAEIESIYHTYQDIGLDWSYINDLDKEIENESLFKVELVERYSEIKGGWDIASTSNDSILTVRGLNRKTNINEIIGEFYVNRIPYQNDLKKFNNKFESTTMQWKYIKRIIQILMIDSINLDGTGMGKVVYQNIQATENSYFKNKVNSTIYDNNWKLSSFINLKQLMTDGKLKRVWNGTKEDNEMLTQMTNLKKLNNSLSSIGRKKDDYPNSLMLSLFNKVVKTRPRIFMV